MLVNVSNNNLPDSSICFDCCINEEEEVEASSVSLFLSLKGELRLCLLTSMGLLDCKWVDEVLFRLLFVDPILSLSFWIASGFIPSAKHFWNLQYLQAFLWSLSILQLFEKRQVYCRFCHTLKQSHDHLFKIVQVFFTVCFYSFKVTLQLLQKWNTFRKYFFSLPVFFPKRYSPKSANNCL